MNELTGSLPYLKNDVILQGRFQMSGDLNPLLPLALSLSSLFP